MAIRRSRNSNSQWASLGRPSLSAAPFFVPWRDYARLSVRPGSGSEAARWIRPAEKSDSPDDGRAGGLKLWRAAFAGLPAEALAKAGGEGGYSFTRKAGTRRAVSARALARGPAPFW